MDLPTDLRWAAVERILSSKQFRNAEKQAAFLKYVTRRALGGRTDEISEQQIGIHVFGRPIGYDASNDNVVRSAARQLRQRLAVYYSEEGESDSIRVIIPTGTYVPTFLDRTVPSAVPNGDGRTALPEAARDVPRTRWALWSVLALLTAAAGVAAWLTITSPVSSTFDRFWLTMMPAGQRMLFVPTDSGIVMFQNSIERNLPLPEYADGSYAAGWDGPKQTTRDRPEFFYGLRRYTSIADLRLYASLVRLPVLDPGRIDVRFARDLTTSDFKRGNVFLTGGPQGNPWVQLFDPSLNFTIVTDDRLGIQTVKNRKPLPAENEPWIVRFREPGHDVFSLIAYLPNLDKTGHVLVISGTTMAGIDAAGDFLGTPGALTPILANVDNGDGTFKPFEVVLKTESVRSGALSSKVVATRW